MELILKVNGIGHFEYNTELYSYIHSRGRVHWALKIVDESTVVDELVRKAELLFVELDRFEELAKMKIAEELIDFKNDVWLEYDENDPELDWDAVDAGEYDLSIGEFIESITLIDIEIRSNEIYCEFSDGDLFGGHRIHAYFSDDYKLKQADI